MEKKNFETLLSRGIENIIVQENVEKKLTSGKKLRIKFGIDPTAPEIHLGHSVILRKLRQFQNLGHKAVLIIGDFTAQIGDPSGRNELRKPLSETEVKKNMKQYLRDAGKIINIEKTEIRYNSEWHKKGGLKNILSITREATVQQILKRDDFEKRLHNGDDISMLELLYPLLQGYDSVVIKADIELGGTDQTFNLLMGRKLQRAFHVPEQDVITLPLLEGTDGTKKMSKSVGNYIALTEKSTDMFGKIMSIPDSLISKYFTLLTDVTEIDSNPYQSKITLATEITRLYHGEKKAQQARDTFIQMFSKKEIPDILPSLILPRKKITLLETLLIAGIPSKSEARRLIEQNAIQINQEVVPENDEIIFSSGDILRIGKKKFFRIQ